MANQIVVNPDTIEHKNYKSPELLKRLKIISIIPFKILSPNENEYTRVSSKSVNKRD